MKKLLLQVMLISLASAPAIAADVNDLINGAFDAASRKERREIGLSFLKRIEKLSAFVPQPTPSENTWVVAEKNEIDKITDGSAKSARLVRYVQSPEFQQSKLKSFLESTIGHLLCVTASNNIRREMLCWAQASSNLLDQSVVDEAIKVLIRHGRVPQDIDNKAEIFVGKDLGYGYFYADYSRGIIKYIVVPYLAAQIKE